MRELTGGMLFWTLFVVGTASAAHFVTWASALAARGGF